MRLSKLKIEGFRGIKTAELQFGRHTALVGPNNCGKTTIIEALALLFGRDRLVRRLTEHDFYGSTPDESTRLTVIATVTNFQPNDPGAHREWFAADRGIEKWLDPSTGKIHPVQENDDWLLAVQVGCAARFDTEELEAEVIRFFVHDENFGDPFAEGANLSPLRGRVLQELGFFLVPATRTWDRWISFSSELFRRVVATLGEVPARAVRDERNRLWRPKPDHELEAQDGIKGIVAQANAELALLISSAPELKLRITATDSNSVLEAVVPHFKIKEGPTLPASRQGSGLVSLQILLLLMQFGQARASNNQSFVLAVEEPELHIQPSQQKRLVNRLISLCDQTIVTTHSPLVASMFRPEELLFVSNDAGTVSAPSLTNPTDGEPSNLEQHLFFAWRQRLISALLHDNVIVPEGASDAAWLEVLQVALETRQASARGEMNDLTRFGTFVGIIPTSDSKVCVTFEIVRRVHNRTCVLLDGDGQGREYLNQLKVLEFPPRKILMWPDGWDMERVVVWIAEGGGSEFLSTLTATLDASIQRWDDFASYLRSKRSYAPTHHAVSDYLVVNSGCRERIELLLTALADVGCGTEPSLFELLTEYSTSTTDVFRLSPPQC